MLIWFVWLKVHYNVHNVHWTMHDLLFQIIGYVIIGSEITYFVQRYCVVYTLYSIHVTHYVIYACEVIAILILKILRNWYAQAAS